MNDGVPFPSRQAGKTFRTQPSANKVCMYVCMYVCTYVHVYMYVCMYVCMYVRTCIYVCMYVHRMYVYVCVVGGFTIH